MDNGQTVVHNPGEPFVQIFFQTETATDNKFIYVLNLNRKKLQKAEKMREKQLDFHPQIARINM